MIALLLHCLRWLPPETAHRIGVLALQCQSALPNKRLGTSGHERQVECFGLKFAHRVGVAAGFDKDAEAYQGLWKRGFAFAEVGTVTPKPQQGNPRPRLFRLHEDRAVINRMGFNNRGMEAMAHRLAQEKQRLGILGINVGPNKESRDPLNDYQQVMLRLAPFADYLAINLSSPNTPGLRALQQGSMLKNLLTAIQQSRTRLAQQFALTPPVLLKIAPDWDSDRVMYDLLDQAVACQIDGIIVSNTTVARPNSLKSRWATQSGGLSGEPLFINSTKILARAYCHLQGEIPLIGVGGINDLFGAVLKMRAGASLVQMYSGLIYDGDKCVAELWRNHKKAKIFFGNDSHGDVSVIGSFSVDFCSPENVAIAMSSRNENTAIRKVLHGE